MINLTPFEAAMVNFSLEVARAVVDTLKRSNKPMTPDTIRSAVAGAARVEVGQELINLLLLEMVTNGEARHVRGGYVWSRAAA
jgi:hypothetical protein